MASTIVLPARLSSAISSTSHCCVRGSRAAVGSSNSRTSGFITRTEAIATRFFSPPESWNGARSASSAIPSIAITSAIRRSTSSGGSPICSGPNAISSRTVGENTWASEFWKMNPTRERNPIENRSSSRFSSVTGWPNARYVPASGKSRPSRILRRVDFPLPLAPRSATFSPRRTESDTPSRAVNRSR